VACNTTYDMTRQFYNIPYRICLLYSASALGTHGPHPSVAASYVFEHGRRAAQSQKMRCAVLSEGPRPVVDRYVRRPPAVS
jgi:hypothetical protein